MRSLIFTLLILSFIILACNDVTSPAPAPNPGSQIIDKGSWIIGKWQNINDKDTMTETWTRLDDSTYVGEGKFIRDSLTVSTESIRLEYRNKKMYYIPSVANQNNGQPIRFTATKFHEEEMVFENFQHDFPQIIAYRKISGDSILAVVSGVLGGRNRSKAFPMARIKSG